MEGDALSCVSFCGKGLKLNTASDADPIIQKMNEKSFKKFDLSGNTLGVEAAKAIGKALESHPEFSVAIWKDMFTGRLKQEIPEAMRYLEAGVVLSGARLMELDLSDNAIGPIGMLGVTDFLAGAACCHLKILRMNNNGLGIQGGKMVCRALMKSNDRLKQTGRSLCLEVLICGRNRLELEGAREFSKLISELTTLKEISMPQNGINAKGMAALFEAFQMNSDLRVINVSDNTITWKGAHVVAEALDSLPSLEILKLSDCLLGNKGAQVISHALESKANKLKELHLDGNEIKIDGALNLIASLKNKEHIKFVNLNGNSFGNGSELIRARLAEQKQLEILGTLSDDEGSSDEGSISDNEDEDSQVGEEEQENEEDYEEAYYHDTFDETEEECEKTDEEKDIHDESGVEIKSEVTNGFTFNEMNNALYDTVNQSNNKMVGTWCQFLLEPSFKSFANLSPNWQEDLIKDLQAEEEPDKYMESFVKLASVFPNADQKSQEIIVSTCETLLKDAFSLDSPSPNITNALLVHMGLLKSEHKVKLVDLNGAIRILASLIGVLPSGTMESLAAFLARPVASWVNYQAAARDLTAAVFRKKPLKLVLNN